MRRIAAPLLIIGLLSFLLLNIFQGKPQGHAQLKQTQKSETYIQEALKNAQIIINPKSTEMIAKTNANAVIIPKRNDIQSEADKEESRRLEKEFLVTSAKRKLKNIISSTKLTGVPAPIPDYFKKPQCLDWKIQTIHNDVTKKTEYLEVVILNTADGENIRLEREAASSNKPGRGGWTEMLGNEMVVTIPEGVVVPSDVNKNGVAFKVVKTKDLNDTYQIHFKSENAESLPMAYDILEKELPKYRNLQPQFIYHSSATPLDPGYTSLTGNRWHLEKIGMPAVWDKIQNSSVTVAVLDTGVNYNHEDLKDNIYAFPDGTRGWDFVGDDPYPLDVGDLAFDGSTIYHGSHCAGIIGMRGNNDRGSVGACYKVNILPIRVIGTTGNTLISSRVKQALAYCSTSTASVQIASMSFTTSVSSTPDSQVQEALTNNFNNGMRIGVISAGNNTNNIDTGFKVWPASFNYSFLIKVAASTNNDSLASFSNYGSTSVDLAAPGTDIYSINGANTTGYTYMSGTSMSAPLVAGALALLRAAAPQKTAAELISCLNSNVDKSSFLNGLVKSGGRLNVNKALAALNFSNSAPYFGSALEGLRPVRLPNRNYDHCITAFDRESNSLSNTYKVINPTTTTNVSIVANLSGLMVLKYLNDGDYTLNISVDDGYITTEQSLDVRVGASYLSDGWKVSYFYPAASTYPVGISTWTTSYAIWGAGAPSGVLNSYDFAVEMEGFYVPLYSGYYSFGFSADGGRRLWVDDVMYIDDMYDNFRLWGESLRSSAYSIYLNKGRPYKIRARYENMNSFSSLYLTLKGPYDSGYNYYTLSKYVTLPDVVITKSPSTVINTPFTLSAINQSPGFYNFIPSEFTPAWVNDVGPINDLGPASIAFSNVYSASTTATATVPGIYTVGLLLLGYENGSIFTRYDLTILSQVQQWCMDQFGSAAPTGVASLTSDYDGDGIPNLIEYAVGTDPKAGNSSSVGSSRTKTGNDDFLTLNINRASLKRDISYVVEVSGDMKTWNSGPFFTTTLTDTSTLLSVRDNTPMSSSSKRFMRLAVKIN